MTQPHKTQQTVMHPTSPHPALSQTCTPHTQQHKSWQTYNRPLSRQAVPQGLLPVQAVL